MTATPITLYNHRNSASARYLSIKERNTIKYYQNLTLNLAQVSNVSLFCDRSLKIVQTFFFVLFSFL